MLQRLSSSSRVINSPSAILSTPKQPETRPLSSTAASKSTSSLGRNSTTTDAVPWDSALEGGLRKTRQ